MLVTNQTAGNEISSLKAENPLVSSQSTAERALVDLQNADAPEEQAK